MTVEGLEFYVEKHQKIGVKSAARRSMPKARAYLLVQIPQVHIAPGCLLGHFSTGEQIHILFVNRYPKANPPYEFSITVVFNNLIQILENRLIYNENTPVSFESVMPDLAINSEIFVLRKGRNGKLP